MSMAHAMVGRRHSALFSNCWGKHRRLLSKPLVDPAPEELVNAHPEHVDPPELTAKPASSTAIDPCPADLRTRSARSGSCVPRIFTIDSVEGARPAFRCDCSSSSSLLPRQQVQAPSSDIPPDSQEPSLRLPHQLLRFITQPIPFPLQKKPTKRVTFAPHPPSVHWVGVLLEDRCARRSCLACGPLPLVIKHFATRESELDASSDVQPTETAEKSAAEASAPKWLQMVTFGIVAAAALAHTRNR
eukprot:TRINITY_DN5755_c0_g1_i1.p2 TRINITY_DN5755_c0_g1~~TRINITY_DN5755_c0_g1_i1.p2  ORF type:complete len:244 (+),score=17.17 TRINITY_DN5755_c0_g1_i1:38-769(+)